MTDRDVVVVGGGPAGLSAGTLLARSGLRVAVLEQDEFGGRLKKVAWFEGLPGYPDGIAGPDLAAELLDSAAAERLDLIHARVEEIETYSSCHSVTCSDGRNFTCSWLVLAGGRRNREPGIQGAGRLRGRGVMDCVMCDAGLYRDRTVAVVGAGDTGLIEALYLACHASRVVIIEQRDAPGARADLLRRAAAVPNIDILCRTLVRRVDGEEMVTHLDIDSLDGGTASRLAVDGVALATGMQPDTGFLEGVLELDAGGAVLTGSDLTASRAGVCAAGDIRAGSALDLPGALADGLRAAQLIEGVCSGAGNGGEQA